MRPVLVVQHQDDCPPAWFGTWMTDAGAVLDVRRPYRGDDLPTTLAAHAGLLVLGGSMGAWEEDRAPWLVRVKSLIREAVADEVPTLGICLGHQVCADALGGTVAAGAATSAKDLQVIGWTEDAAADPLFGTRPTAAPQWNDDVVSVVPAGAVVLATAGDGDIQVVRFGPSAWGIQAHPEADERVVGAWVAADAEAGSGSHDDALNRIAAERAVLTAQWSPVAAAFARSCRRQAFASP